MIRPSPVAAAERTGSYDLVEADFPPWEGVPRRTILLCSHPRSGSTMLGETLFAAGNFGCPIEYFHRGFQPVLARRWGIEGFPAYLRAVYRHRTDPSGTLGVKLFWPDVEGLFRAHFPDESTAVSGSGPRSLTPLEQRKIGAMVAALFPNATFVHLVRIDALRQAVSALIATQTRVWRRVPGVQDNAPAGPPRFDYQRIAEILALGEYCRESWAGFFAANNLGFHHVTYEGLAGDYEATVRAVFSALGRPEATVRAPRLRRQANRTSEEMVRRFLDEMRARSVESAP